MESLNETSFYNRLLIVDDEDLNLDILEEYLDGRDYEIIKATNGEEALNIVSEDRKFDAIILDRMMPIMDGIEFLKSAKKSGFLINIPVIMQTAASNPTQIQEGIEAGVFYYLTKPYTKGALLSVLNSALDYSIVLRKVHDEFNYQKQALSLLKKGSFHFQTLDEAKNLSVLIANFCPNHEKTAFGLNELTVNSVEHGNLDITYSEKKNLLEMGKWRDEVYRRLSIKENKSKFATLDFVDDGKYINITISDSGKGFDYKKYFEIDSDRMTDPNGRGIAITRAYAFDNMEYIGSGNTVKCVIIK